MFCLVAVLIAVIICLVMQSSAKALNEVSLSSLKSLIALYNPIIPSCTISSRSAPIKNTTAPLLAQSFCIYESNTLMRQYRLYAQDRQLFHPLVVRNEHAVFSHKYRPYRSPDRTVDRNIIQ